MGSVGTSSEAARAVSSSLTTLPLLLSGNGGRVFPSRAPGLGILALAL